jgi:hypothetical protein
MAGETSIALGTVQAEYTRSFPFNDYTVTVTSPPEGFSVIDVSDSLRDPADYHGDPQQVHDVVQLGRSLVSLVGQSHERLFDNRKGLAKKGIIIMADHYDEAKMLVSRIDGLAQRVIGDASLYDDVGFCREYYFTAREGFNFMRDRLNRDFNEIGQEVGLPISLERAGLVTTRLAQGKPRNGTVPDEIRVVTKRAHPKDGDPADQMVTVFWRNLDDVTRINGRDVEIADFVNPASWASTAGLLLSLRSRGSVPKTLIHRSFMVTEQGVALSRRLLSGSDLGPVAVRYYALGSSRHLDDHYYLHSPAVADAGHVLRHFQPENPHQLRMIRQAGKLVQ